jgi:hypothetical protein
MPAPNSTTFQRPDLGQSFEEFDLRSSMQGFIGLQVLPLFTVARQTANFSKVKVASLLAERLTTRAPGGGYARQDWEFEQDSYETVERGAEEVLDDRERAIYSYTLDFERIAAMRAMDAVLRDMERRIAAAVFNTGTFTGALTTAVTVAWTNPSTATPIDDMFAAHNTFKANAGVLPNALVINDVTFRALQRCDQVIDQLKYSGVDDPKRVTASMLAALFNIDRIIVANTQRNSALQGQTATFANIWGSTQAMVCRIATSQDLKEPCLGRTFHWTGDGSSEGGTAEMYRDERVRADIMRVRIDVGEKLLHTSMGLLLTNVG